jgi:hypothetical protein
VASFHMMPVKQGIDFIKQQVITQQCIHWRYLLCIKTIIRLAVAR